MAELLTVAQMRAVERDAMTAGEVTGLELMERAGRGVVEAMLAWRPELATAPRRAVVLCGPGNNGGDGFVVARLLKARGWEVEVFLYGDPASLPTDAYVNFQRWAGRGDVTLLGYPELTPSSLRALEQTMNAELMLSSEGTSAASAVIVDAIFGTGLTRSANALSPLFRMSGRAHEDFRPALVAVDIPSGLCADSGRLLGPNENPETPGFAGTADLTVTFHRAKLGHYLADGPRSCGHLVIADIGLGISPVAGAVKKVSQSSPDALAKGKDAHKYDHGHCLVLSGGVGRGGAARLAARGALRIGAGLVTVGCPPMALQENAAGLDAIMLTALPDAQALAEFVAGRKVNAVCIGPGFGHGERLREFVAAMLRRDKGDNCAIPAVLDADALSVFADDPNELFGMLHERCVLTPHQGEFGRLFPDLVEKLTAPATKGPAYSKVDATREAAARAGCVVLFKGADTVIADPTGRCALNSAAFERAAPWLATAGTGDVLAGVVTGLLARGFRPVEAAEAAAWLHVECALLFGPGLIAEDLPEQIPAVFRRLGL